MHSGAATIWNHAQDSSQSLRARVGNYFGDAYHRGVWRVFAALLARQGSEEEFSAVGSRVCGTFVARIYLHGRAKGGDHALFVVHASSATTFRGSIKEAEKNLLVNVEITVFGRKGDRNDVIHTDACDFYRPETDKNSDAKAAKSSDRGSLICAGEVKMDLQSAKDAKRASAAPTGTNADPRIIHVLTKGLTFDSNTADAHTDQPVDFQFSGGRGHAIGANYGSNDGTLELLHEVHLSLKAAPPQNARNQSKPSSAPIPVEVTGSSIVFRREAKTAVLHGPVVVTQVTAAPPVDSAIRGAAAARTGTHVLHASLLTVNMDADFHAKQVIADGDAKNRPNLVMDSPKGAGTVTADKFVTDLDVDGTAKHFSAQRKCARRFHQREIRRNRSSDGCARGRRHGSENKSAPLGHRKWRREIKFQSRRTHAQFGNCQRRN